MKEILLYNLDFIYLFYGVAFFFLGTACLVLHSREKSKKALSWLVLSFFGFIHGINEWLDMISLSFADPRFLPVIRGLFLALSYFCLLEFSRRSFNILEHKGVGARSYIPLTVFIAFYFFSLKSPDSLGAAIRYSLGLPAALWAAYVFWNLAGKTEARDSRNLFRTLAILFVLYALATGLIVPKADFWPASHLNQATFLEWVRIPIQVFRGFFVTVIAFLFIYEATKRTLSMPGVSRGTGYVKFVLSSFLILYLIALSLGFYVISKVDRHERQHLNKMILSDARLLGKSIADIDVESLAAPDRLSLYPRYRQIHHRMSELVEITNFVKSLYLIYLKENKPFFLIGSQTHIFPPEFVPVSGKRIHEKTILDAFYSKQPTIETSYDGGLGRTLSVFVPVADGGGEVTGLLGIDLDSAKVQSQLSRIRFYVLFVIMTFLAFLIIGYAFLIVTLLRSLELEVQKNNLNSALVSLREIQAQLARSEETFRGILDNSPNAIFGFDRDSRTIFWNYGAEHLYGYKKSEVVDEKRPLLNKKISDVIGLHEMNSVIKRVFLGETHVSESLHKTRTGQAEVVMTLFPVKDRQGNILFGMGLIQDMSAHKKIERTLHEERDRLNKIATSIGAGLSLVDKHFNIVWVNEVLENWFGKLSSIQGRKCFQAYQFKNSVCEGCPTRKALETGEMQSSEQRSVFPDGRVMDFLLICSPIKNERGETEQVLELTLDITERKKMLRLLEYERALSRNVIDSIGEELIVMDCQKRTILDVNRKFSEFVGRKKEEIIGKRCDELGIHLCPPCESCDFDEVAREGRTIEATHVHQTPSGKKEFVDVTLSPLTDERGRIMGVIHLSRNVTDRKRLEDELRRYSESLESLVKDRTKALQKSELMFRRLFESAQDGILIIDAESGKIIDVNPYILDMLECTREQLQNLDYRRIPYFVEAGIFEKALSELRDKASVHYGDIFLKTCSGREIAVELAASVYFVEDKKTIQCNIRDITERKRVDKVKTEFVSMVSHELRTPLSAIKEGVEIVADGTQGRLNADQQESLGIALSNIKRLNRLIGDILDISKIQSNLLRISLVPCDVYDIIEQVYNLVRIEIEKRGMLFVTDIEKNLPLVSADKDRLIQVLMNLLNNAVKFTREKSRIVLICRRSGAFVEFGVKDEGAGLREQEISQLFGKFVQLDSTLVRRVGGTGLGLYISRNLVEAMGGQIWAESRVGEGSVFRFTIPAKKEFHELR